MRFLRSLYDKIEIRRFVRRVYRWAIKSIQYSKFLWNDTDHDYASLLWLLQYKIGRMRRAIHKANIVVCSDEIAREMLVAELMIQKLIDDEFLPELDKAHTEKWGEQKMDFIKQPNGNSKLDMYRTKARAQGPAAEAQEKQEWWDMMKRQEAAKEKMRHDLFKWIGDHIIKWWD